MTVVVGTAGHIDHGKTSLLRALTGIDADRLPEEQRRGMTIDVGYAHTTLADGAELDFVDVPGHDRLIGNMLVGAGEIDAALLVVAADDGPRAQTLEHLELLDALAIDIGLAVVTKTDLVPAKRVAEVMAEVADLLAGTSLRGAPVVAASAMTRDGLDAVRLRLADVQAAVLARPGIGRGPARLAIDRVFSVRGRGVVVTGSLRGGGVTKGDSLRVMPAGVDVRVREIQVHNRGVDAVAGGGRVALNVAGVDAGTLRRGDTLTSGPALERTDRLLVNLRPGRADALRHGLRVRIHLGTEQVDGVLDLSRRAAVTAADGTTTAIVRVERAIAAGLGDRFVLRRPSPGETLAGGLVVDPLPPRGVSRRRAGPDVIRPLVAARPGSMEQLRALVALHGALPSTRVTAWAADAHEAPADLVSGRLLLADDVSRALDDAAGSLVGVAGSMRAAELRSALIVELRRRVSLDLASAAAAVGDVVDRLVGAGRLVRDGERLLPEGAAAGPDPELQAAMNRLEAMLAVPAPPSLRAAAAAAGCPLDGIRALEGAGRIVRVEDDLAWQTATLREFQDLAVRLAAAGPLSPAAFRDATGTSRRFALAILEDLNRQSVLRRTPDGHLPGPRAARPAADAPR